MSEDPGRLKPFRPTTDDPAEYWMWIHYVLEFVETQIPWGEDPQKIFWDHPDDDAKDQAEKFYLERDHLAETDKALTTYFQKMQWPRAKSAVAFYAQKRLKFAQQQVKLFATKSKVHDKSLVHIPGQPHRDVMLWLLCDVYRASKGF